MNAYTPLTKIPAYSAAKAGIPAFVCGGSDDIDCAERFVRGGARILSVFPRSIPAGREHLSGITL